MKEKTNVRETLVPLLILFASFIGVTLCSMIFMAKDNNYDNMINQYFNISKELYAKLIYLHVSKEVLVNGMNLCSLAFLFGNFMLVWQISSAKEKKKRRGLLIAASVYLLLQAIAYNTGFQRYLYFGDMGFLPNPRIFRRVYGTFHYITVIGNFLILIIGCGFLFLMDLRKKQIPEFFRVKRAIFLTQISLAGLYFYMFFSLPDSFLWMSRSTGYISYHSLKMAPYVNGMRAVIWLILAFLIILFYNMYRYQLMRERVSQENHMAKQAVERNRRKLKQNLVGWGFILPSLVVFFLFMFLPIALGFWYSLTDYTGLSKNYQFIGLQNYIKMFSDRYFKVSIKNNCIYAIWFSVLTMLVSLILASLLNRLMRFRKFFRIAFFLPYISSMVSVAVIWKMIFNPQGGPLNTILEQIGISNPPQWLASTTWALYAVIIVSVWKNCGYYMMIFLAGLQNVPDSLYEAASLDGAGKLQQYFKITLPLISPTIFLNLILVTINSFQVFDLVSVMTDGGPGMSTNVLAYRIYYEGFKSMHMGYASAIAYFLFAVILVITIIQFVAQKHWVNYD